MWRQEPHENILRNAILAEIVGAWEVMTASPPQDPYDGSYFVIKAGGVFGWVRAKSKLTCASEVSLCEIIDAAGQGGDKREQWLNFVFSDGTVIVRYADGGKAHHHWFRTAILSGRHMCFPAPMELKPGDIVWTEILPDPNKLSQSQPRAVDQAPDTVRPRNMTPPRGAGIDPTSFLQPGYDPFLDIGFPQPRRPDWNDPIFQPPRLISPQPRREYRLRRLPDS